MQEWIHLATLALKISVFMQVFATGLGTTWHDATYLFRRPRLLVNSILARNVIVPVVAVLLIKAFPFHIAVTITLGLLAVTPVPPLLPKSQFKAGCSSEYVIGLLVSQAILAAVLVPATLKWMNWALGSHAHFRAGQVAVLMAETILIPLAVGMLASRIWPRLSRISAPLLTVGAMLLIAGAIPLFILGWKAFGTLSGEGALLAMAIFVVGATLAGELLGGPRAEDRTALALAASSRHPGLALGIAQANYPEQIRLVAGAIVIYLVLRMIVSIPYLRRFSHPRQDLSHAGHLR